VLRSSLAPLALSPPSESHSCALENTADPCDDDEEDDEEEESARSSVPAAAGREASKT
jgi:hypothetical protein